MQIIADLHLHSKYSRAVSPKMELTEIANWSQKKGIDLVATGDWTHPMWLKSIKADLVESSPGLFSLKKDDPIKFILSTEISSIYTQGNQVRRIHNLIFSPSIATCEKIIERLRSQGANLMSDGRPIIGLSAKGLLELVMEVDKNALLIPCHAWTPWFSLYGSKSGFNSIEECFGDYANYIYAVESGLSSDPIMNWQIKELENRSIVSFSDAHSGAKLGREATVFVPAIKQYDNITMTGFSFQDIIDAIKQTPNSKLKIGYTIEFFPEEGKYHWTGHRNCNIKYNPQQVKEKGVICPVCRQSLTVGVENRVLDLAYKSLTPKDLTLVKNKADLTFVYDKEKKRKPFVSVVPLLEILAEINNGSPTKAVREYERLIPVFATEFDLMLKKTYEEIEKAGGAKFRQAIEIVRNRQVFVDPGYDGVFGQVKIFKENAEKPTANESVVNKTESQPTLF